MSEEEPRDCPCCKVKPNEPHEGGCDVARCSVCNGQWIGCGHLNHDPSKVPWTGFWPGVVECRELGWYSYADPDGPGPYWKRCDKDHPGADADLNRWAMHVARYCPDEPSWDQFERAGSYAGTLLRHLRQAGIEPPPILVDLEEGQLPITEQALAFLKALDSSLREEFSHCPEVMDDF